MPTFGPIKRMDLIHYLRQAGFDGPYSGGRHQYMIQGGITITLPNPHQGDIGREFLARILRQAGISRDEWENCSQEQVTITRTAHYDRIARQWHRITGHHGSAFKRYVLNDVLIEAIGGIEGVALLELGTGNGYFLPLALRRYSGQTPARIVISDQSSALLAIAQSELRVAGAEYQLLDVREPFPFAAGDFDLLLATMLFNELTDGEMRRALAECARVLRPDGRLLATVTHPAFVASLAKRGQLRDLGRGLATLPGADGVPLPVTRRSMESYTNAVRAAGFMARCQDVRADEKVLHEKPGLRHAGNVPLALLLECEKPGRPEPARYHS